MTSELVAGSCVVCGPVEQTKFTVDEGMYRSGESFTYGECASCGSLQILDPPDDLAPYYAGSYYSFRPGGRAWMGREPLRSLLRLNGALFERTGLGKGKRWLREVGVRRHDRILDFGCGGGALLETLDLLGYSDLTGADPFLPVDTTLPAGVRLLSRDHRGLTGSYDWVMMHHAFEHVSDPRAVLRSLRGVVSRAGAVLIGMPVAGGAAWRQYGERWVQLDPPRHLVLFSSAGVERLARDEGYTVERVVYDSTAFQFWGSELVSAGVPHVEGPGRFDRQQMRRWQQRAGQLNAAGDGDQALFVLRRAR